MKRFRLVRNLMLITLVSWVAGTSAVWAGHKPGHDGGGGNPGGGEPAAYNIVAFEPTGAAPLSTSISDLSNNNAVVGWEETGDSQVQSWHLDLGSSVYTPLPGYATALSDAGQITFVMAEGSPNGHYSAYFLNDLTAEPVRLPPLPGDDATESRDVNNDGYIIGYSWNSTGSRTAVVWRSIVEATGNVLVDGPISLPTLLGDSDAYVGELGGIRDGVLPIVGSSLGNGSAEAVIWSLELGTQGALPTSAAAIGLGVLGHEQTSYSHGWAINAQGNAVGESDYLPFYKLASSEIEALPVPRDAADGTWATDINEAGDVVGQVVTQRVSGAKTHPREFMASLWSDNQHVDLNTLIDGESGWGQLEEATRINDHGLIAGSGLYGESNRGFVMVPTPVSAPTVFAVPEPSGAVVALLAILLPAYRFRLRRPGKT